MAVTRARRHVALVCDTGTVGRQPFLQRLLAHVSQHGDVRSAFEYLGDFVPQSCLLEGQSPRQGGAKLPAAPSPKPQPPPAGKRRAAAAGAARPKAGAQSSAASPDTSGPGRESPETRGGAERLRAMLGAFLESSEVQLDFPPSLNAHDRMLVHQMAKELGLQHGSTGEGRDRFISVRRKEPPEPALPAATFTSEQHPLPQPQHPSSESPAPAEPGGSSQGSGKVDLKALHLERVQREKARREEAARKAQEPRASSRKKNKSEGKGRSQCS